MSIATGVKTRGFGNPLGSDFLGTSNPTKSAKLVLEQFRAGEPPIRENRDDKSLTGIPIFYKRTLMIKKVCLIRCICIAYLND